MRIEPVTPDTTDIAAELLARFFVEEGFAATRRRDRGKPERYAGGRKLLERTRCRRWRSGWRRYGNHDAVRRMRAAWRDRRPLCAARMARRSRCTELAAQPGIAIAWQDQQPRGADG